MRIGTKVHSITRLQLITKNRVIWYLLTDKPLTK